MSVCRTLNLWPSCKIFISSYSDRGLKQTVWGCLLLLIEMPRHMHRDSESRGAIVKSPVICFASDHVTTHESRYCTCRPLGRSLRMASTWMSERGVLLSCVENTQDALWLFVREFGIRNTVNTLLSLLIQVTSCSHFSNQFPRRRYC